MSTQEFSGQDYEFAAGTIKGIRTWTADDQGRLRGVSFSAVWRPGENIASCSKSPADWAFEPDCISCTDREPHHFDPDCTCGFWAYDEHHLTPHGGGVIGIIEGYGKTTIGTKGFRCEKARIVALCRERLAGGDLSLSLWLRLQQLYPDVAFYDYLDDMVTAHGAVLRSWEPVGEGFWDQSDDWASGAALSMVRAQAAMHRLTEQMKRGFTIPSQDPKGPTGGQS